jgi:hypothetical protein
MRCFICSVCFGKRLLGAAKIKDVVGYSNCMDRLFKSCQL